MLTSSSLSLFLTSKRLLRSYGLTENCATCAKAWPNDPTASGTVGPPQPINEVKLIDVPAMGYTSEDKPNPRGELCVRGTNCFTTYYKGKPFHFVGFSNLLTLRQTKRTRKRPLMWMVGFTLGMLQRLTLADVSRLSIVSK